ncbi:hypothetical protein DFJ73DRAFT_777913 [Zopfochytrium polystomum]|nr:hypothetical protein DFJ73DRAFT_777913 [Zopfochytrium polystomum]
MPRLIPFLVDLIGISALFAAVRRIGNFVLAPSPPVPFPIRHLLAHLLALGDASLDLAVDLARRYPVLLQPASEPISAVSATKTAEGGVEPERSPACCAWIGGWRVHGARLGMGRVAWWG